MAYSASISRVNPSCLLFVIDQSASMSDPLLGESKADYVAMVLNRTLQDLVLRCSKDDGIRDYFHVGILGYHGNVVENALDGELAHQLLHPVSQLDCNPLKVEEIQQKVPDGAGGLVSIPVKFPIWYAPKAGGGTPMSSALKRAAQELAEWCDEHQNSFPPVVMHLTDGQSTDGDPTEIANVLRQIGTDDGQVVLMNIHVSPTSAEPVSFPSDDSVVGRDQYAKLLFDISSVMPASMIESAKVMGYNVTDNSRGYIFGGKAEEIVQFFEIGTRPAELR